MAKLKEEHNPNFNDEGVKRAVRAWEEYAARDTNDSWEEAYDRDLDEIVKGDDQSESGINWAEWENGDSSLTDADALYSFSAYLPPSLRLWLEDKVSAMRRILVENGVLADNTSAGTTGSIESPALTSARKSLSDAQTDWSNTDRDLKDHIADLEKDYGPDSIFRALKDVCITKDSGEYSYELCFLGSTKQKPKKGGGDSALGHYVRLDTEFVDDEVGPDGKGLGRGERITMRYENGQHCWNGPARSTLVVLACAEKDEIWKVSESEKCVYRMEVGTAAVCGLPNENLFQDSAESVVQVVVKDEL